jgi:TonB-linked SusC/RagA family outer membrane protein
MKRIYTRFRILLLLLVVITLSSSAYAQRKVSGKVTNATDGQSLPGVTVAAKGSSVITVTDINGNFTINNLPKSATALAFTSIGFVSETVTIDNRTEYSIALKEDKKLLDEVVVVGYGKQSRALLTTSVSKLDTKTLQSVSLSNPGEALQGTVSGLRVINTTGQPGALPSILLRGGASIDSPGSPLVVVDGVIRSLSDINPSDIESIQILKDAASTAIYGARANNGVILITTNQGKAGVSQITYSVKTGINQRRDGYSYLDAQDYLYYNRLGNKYSGRTLLQTDQSNGYGTAGSNQKIFDLLKINSSNRSQFQSLLKNGYKWMIDSYNNTDTLMFKDHGGQVQAAAFNNNVYTQDHFLSFTGGNDKGKFSSSLGYYTEDGLVVSTKYQRITGTLNGSYMVKKNFEVFGGLNFSESKDPPLWTSEANLFYRTMSLWPTYNPWDANGNPTSGNGSSDGNPLYWINKLISSNDTRRSTYNTGFKWELLPSLFLKATANIYYIDYTKEDFNKAYQAQTAANPTTARVAGAEYTKTLTQQHNITLDYKKSFGNHNLSLLVGSEYYDSFTYDLYAQGDKAPTDDIQTLNAITERLSTTSSKTESKMLSGFGRLNYDYAGKYLFTAVARYDGISKLATKNQWGFFPGVSFGWNAHQEDFFKNSFLSNYVNTLKPRISYGVNGNVGNLGDYEVQGGYGTQTLYNGKLGFLNTGIINPNLQWEKSTSLEAGLDVGLFNNRVTLVGDYFSRLTSELLTNLALPGYTGFDSFRTNLGTLRNRGFEIEATINVLKLKNGLTWDVTFNASTVKNKIIKLPYNGVANNRQGGMQVYDPNTKQVIWVGGYQEGGTLGDVYAYKEIRVFKDQNDVNTYAGKTYDKIAELLGPTLWNDPTISKTGRKQIEPGDVLWADLDHNDTIDSRDRVKVGNVNPKWTGGFSSTLSYKGFSLFARFDYSFGQLIYNDVLARTYGQYQGTFNMTDLVLDSWTPTNTNTIYPKFYYADQLAKKNITRENNAVANLNGNSSLFYEKGDYVALRELTISYQLPKLWVTKVRLSSVRINLTGQNLAYFTKYRGTSPELGGVDSGRYPLAKSYILGLQVSF